MKRIVNVKDVETQVFPWGTLSWLSEPRVTGTDNMTAGLVVLEPGKGHARHNHPGCDEVLFILAGEGVQTLEEEGNFTKQTVKKGDLIRIPSGVFHSTMNTGTKTVYILAIYQFPGPETELRNSPDCKIKPAENAITI
jgi:oxalate decarboxylase/phosphoglucose isomerase-like protein (cupin superfamily)